jgi:hypothetical protein
MDDIPMDDAPFDYATLPDLALAQNLKKIEGRFLTVFGHINLLAMSNEVSKEDFRIWIRLSRETRRRVRLNVNF